MSEDSLRPRNYDFGVQYDFDVESNVLWVDTINWKFQADVRQMDLQQIFKSKSIKFSSFPDDRFYLEIKKVTPKKFAVALVREAAPEVPDDGYYFQIAFTLVGSLSHRRVTHMMYDAEKAEVDFHLDAFTFLFEANDVWLIKCVVWLHERSDLDNDRRKEQELLLREKLKEAEASPSQLDDMACVLDRETLENIFTGRLDNKLADYKSSLLMRSLRYSDKLLSGIGSSQNQRSFEYLGRLLEYIRTGRECRNSNRDCRISNRDCIVLYASAFSCGLSYLKLQCSEYIKMNFMDVDFFIDALIVSYVLNDDVLALHALLWYSKNKEKIVNSVKWRNFRNRNPEIARGFRLLFLKFDLKESGVDFKKHVSSFNVIPT